MTNSAIYEGTVRHRRFLPVPHKFRYRVFMLYLDLAELDEQLEGAAGWSARGAAPGCFRREDFFGDPARPLDACVRDAVEYETGLRPSGPIRMLANLRYFGVIMNPITCYYCFDESGERLQSVLAVVTNTPWQEQHHYVIDVRDGVRKHKAIFSKQMHVSPFNPMDMDYHWYGNTPGKQLYLHLENHRGAECHTDATLVLARRPMAPRAMTGLLVRYPWMTVKVLLAIYWQALRLWLRGAVFHSHPVETTSGDIGR